jgi:cytochrome c oxidase cbb3-type subunit I
MTKGAPSTVADEIDISCRAPLLLIFLSSAVWLAIGSAFGLIGSIKFHQPNFLADAAWSTYGRVHAAYLTAWLYGFCVPAGLGLALWFFARLGRVPLQQPLLVALGAGIWNLGIAAGVGGILLGDSTGFETLEMPHYGALLVFIGYLLIGISATLTLHERRERSLFVSQWFLLAGLFWFPWIYSTANLLLVDFPVRGVTQAVIGWWYANNFLNVWMALVGLGVVFYLLPKLLNRELDNYYLAVFAFWTLVLFSSWAGIPNTAPVPAWMPTLSTIATAFSILPILAVALNLQGTLSGNYSKLSSHPTLLFVGFGAGAFVVAGLLRIFGVFVDFTQQLQFTWFEPGRSLLNLYGFFAMVLIGGVYYIAPRVVGIEFPSPKLVRAHFWLAALGLLLLVVPMVIGGLVQASQLQQQSIAFMDIAHGTLRFLRMTTVGDLLLLVGHVFLVGNLLGLGVRLYRAQAIQAYSQATADLFKPAEVKP